MPCLLALPSASSKGIISLTEPEWRSWCHDVEGMERIARLREKFLVGCHYNWHPIGTPIDERFDFHFALAQDIVTAPPSRGRLLGLDACNFTPDYFDPGSTSHRPIDVLVIARAVYFKRPELAMRTLWSLSNARPELRVHAVLAVPPDAEKHLRNEIGQVSRRLNRRATTSWETDPSAGLTLDVTSRNYPFPYSRAELASLMASSKVFPQFTSVEYRSRTTSYALCAGARVIGHHNVGQLLPAELRSGGSFKAVRDDADFAPAILDAVQEPIVPEVLRLHEEFRADSTVPRLRAILSSLMGVASTSVRWTSEEDLDLRLGRHIKPQSDPNSIEGDLPHFLETLASTHETELQARVAGKRGLDVEEMIATDGQPL